MLDQSRRRFLAQTTQAVGIVALGPLVVRGELIPQTADPATLARQGSKFLLGRQSPNGSWSPDRNEPGITALVVTAILRSQQATADDPAITRALSFLEGFVDPKGGLAKAPHSVYSTSVALMAFQEANRGGRFDTLIQGAQTFLKLNQTDESEGKAATDPAYGGSNYGGGAGRPDLSNTSFMMESLHDTGLPADDPALQKALVFVSRCQNLKSEFNDQPWADKVGDGGFIYVAAGRGGEAGKAARKVDDPIPSNAGMTYAGLKSMIYAGLKPDDVRVKAALGYLAQHYTVEENPGQGQRGLYYYYHTFARALSALGQPTFVDHEQKSHDWKADLIAALAKRQEPSGAWVNREDRFMEGDANIVTSYALLALAATKSNR